MKEKNFKDWNLEKIDLEDSMNESLIFNERDIWWCSIGVNLGDEQDGKNGLFERPILVIKKFNNRVAWVLPMSTKHKDNPYYRLIIYKGQTFSVILSQLRLVSVKRFRRFIRKISPLQFRDIKNSLREFLK